MTDRTGSCLCGKITYVLHGDPEAVGLCHCTNCQKQSGSAFSIVALAKADKVAIRGGVKTYKDKGDSGLAVKRNFCPKCGSPISSEAQALPGMTILKAGTFHDTTWLKPGLQVFCDSAQSWLKLPEGTQNFPRMPG